MANEISASCALSASKGGASVNGSGSFQADLSGSEMFSSVQNIATSAQALSIGGCDQVEFLFVKNMDASNNLTLGLDSPITQVLSVIKPGKSVLLSGVSTTLYAKATGSAVDAFVVAVES